LLSPPEYFGGRDAVYHELAGQLRSGAGLTAVQGLGGIGKTTLARQLAYDLHQ